MPCESWSAGPATMSSLATNCIKRWPSKRARIWAARFLQRVRGDTNVLAVVGIGSAVRTGVVSDDLDILVICTDKLRFRERPPMEIDLRVYGMSAVDEKIAAGHDLLGWAVLFGALMFDRNGVWRSIVQRWEGRVPLPDPCVSRQRAATSQRRFEEMRALGDEEAALEFEVASHSHQARAVLAGAGVHAASRPELPDQLDEIGARGLARSLRAALAKRTRLRAQLVE